MNWDLIFYAFDIYLTERLLEDLIRSEQDMNNTGDFETSNSKFNLYLESAVNSLNLS